VTNVQAVKFRGQVRGQEWREFGQNEKRLKLKAGCCRLLRNPVEELRSQYRVRIQLL